MSTSKRDQLKVGDRVRERLAVGDRNYSSNPADPYRADRRLSQRRVGEIVSLEQHPDRNGRMMRYARIRWDHLKTPSLHALFRVEILPNAVHSLQQRRHDG